MTKKTTILNKYGSHCAYCGAEITLKTMQVDHLRPKTFGGSDDIENLMPSCKFCNNYKGAWTLEEFRYNLQNLLKITGQALFKSKTKQRISESYGFITYGSWDGKFYFEKL